MSLQGGARHLALNCGDRLEVDVELELRGSLEDAACIIDILDERGVPLSGRRIRLPEATEGMQRLRVRVAFRAELARGIYRVRARLVQAPERHQHHRRVLCRYESDLSFEVIDNSIERFSGLFPLPAEIVVQPLPADDDGN
jgi:lipopolysaccharide transport system ATP-binding protein